MISRYRIKEVDGKFIPQVWSFGWEGISRDEEITWYTDDCQLEFCGWNTLEQARERVQRYRSINKQVRYHKV